MSLSRIAYFTGFALVFFWFMAGGIAHFVALKSFTSIVPTWVPYPREVALLTGITDIAGALGILWRRTRRITGYALMLYCVCVLPVHIDMLRDAAKYPVSLAVLWGRLLFQPILIWIIWIVTKPAPKLMPDAR